MILTRDPPLEIGQQHRPFFIKYATRFTACSFPTNTAPFGKARDTKKYLNKESHISGKDLNSGHPEYKSELPTTQKLRSVSLKKT